MKNYNKIIIAIFLSCMTFSCNDEFMDRTPQAALVNDTYWTSEASLDIYNKGIYEEAGNNGSYSFLLGHFNSAWSSGFNGMSWEDCQSDNGAPLNGALNQYAIVASGQHVVDANPGRKGWRWGLLRRINYGLANYDKTPISQEIIDKYVGEARLFRAWFYFDKVKRFGGVPWIEEPLNIESAELTAPRDSRDMVMEKILEDLDFAIANLPASWEMEGRFSRWVALALKARISLYEGTHRKYHNRSGHEIWLQEAVNAAKEIMDDGNFALYSTNDPQNDYNMLFRQVDLNNNPEVIAYRRYVTGVNGHRLNGYQRARTNGLTKDLVEDYLCTDGLPIQLSVLYAGNTNLQVEHTNRDPRLRQTTLHPDDAEKYMTQSDFDAGPYPRFSGMSGGFKSSTGYTMIKFYDKAEIPKGFGKEENDAILFRLGEVYLNYAEALAELGTLTQGDLDISINELRERVGMPPLTTTVDLDPKYANEGISALLVEIRRERRVELAFEGFRYDDIVRWKKGEYLTKRVLGMRLEDSDLANYPDAQVTTTTVNGEKYLDVYQGSPYENRIFDPAKHYLFPIATSVMAQNDKIEQNPGW